MKLYKLFPGNESEEKIKLLIKAANIKSKSKADALIDHFVNGTQQSVCESVYGLKQQTISSAAIRLGVFYELACKVVSCK